MRRRAAINGFLSSIAGCRSLGAVPEQSPFYNAWIEVGLRQLREKPSVYDALFDHGGLDRPVNDTLALLTNTSGWTSQPCDGIFGVTATRLDARQIDIDDPDAVKDGATPGVTLARQTEKFLLSFDVGGPDARPRFSSYRLAWEDGSPPPQCATRPWAITPPAKPGDVVVQPEDLRRCCARPRRFRWPSRPCRCR